MYYILTIVFYLDLMYMATTPSNIAAEVAIENTPSSSEGTIIKLL